MRRTVVWLVIMMAAVCALPAQAQTSSGAVVGAWERISQTNAEGTASSSPYMLVVFSDSGVFTQINIAKDRPKVDKPVGQLTESELRARFTGVQAVYGTYTAAGGQLTRHVIGALNPNNEGEQLTTAFRIEGDMLIAWDPTSKIETRFRRVHDASLQAR